MHKMPTPPPNPAFLCLPCIGTLHVLNMGKDRLLRVWSLYMLKHHCTLNYALGFFFAKSNLSFILTLQFNS